MIHQPLNNLFLIDLDQPRRGFRKFISSWVCRIGGLAILVDPGPASTVEVLLDRLASLGIEALDFILITHIHIDHVGSLGLVLKKYPKARVLCHRKVIRHLIDPSKLWKGSLEVLGSLAELYGPIEPVPAANLSPEYLVRANGVTIETIETPGHASHHVCYRLEDILFAGEVAGVTYPCEEGLYLRIASPARFVYEEYRQSVMRAASVDVSHLCFGHYGYRKGKGAFFDAACRQIDLWLEIVEKHVSGDDEDFDTAVFEEILSRDPALRFFESLPFDVQERERYFAANSIKGMRGYLEEKADSNRRL